MTDAAELRDIMVDAIKAAGTDVGGSVYPALDWATWSGSYPVAYFQPFKDAKESLGNQTAQQFKTVTTFPLLVRIERNAEADNIGTAKTQLALEAIKRQIERALINYPPLYRLIEHMPFLNAEMDVDGEGAKNLGELRMDIALEYYQGPEDFYDVPADPIERLNATADLTNVFDPTGVYPDPPFPGSVKPEPRTEGPDGRAEGGIDITFTP